MIFVSLNAFGQPLDSMSELVAFITHMSERAKVIIPVAYQVTQTAVSSGCIVLQALEVEKNVSYFCKWIAPRMSIRK